MSHEKVRVKSLSPVWLFATAWTVAYQAPLSMGFSRQEHWSGLPFPSPGDLSDPGVEPGSPVLQADALPLSHEEVHIVGAHWFLPSGSEEEGAPRSGLHGHAAHLYPWRGLRSKG